MNWWEWLIIGVYLAVWIGLLYIIWELRRWK